MRKHNRESQNRRTRWLSCGLAMTAIIAGLACASPPTSGGHVRTSAARFVLPVALLGQWKLLAEAPGLVTGESTPTIWLGPGDEAVVVWQREVKSGQFTYETADLDAKGNTLGLSEALNPTMWGSLTSEPSVVSDHGQPLILFNGGGTKAPYSNGCIVGDLRTSTGWALQAWSLSSNCNIPGMSAAAGPNGVYSASWPGGGWNTTPVDHGMQYRIGVSATIPAAGLDGRIPAPVEASNVYKTGEVSDLAGSGHFYVVWGLTTTTPGDAGYYVKDVTADGQVRKVPETGETSVTPNIGVFSNLAVTNTNTHAGVWILYCTNTSVCSLRLWRVGITEPIVVPGSAAAANYAVSAGPDGRLWVAWTTSKSPYDMYVVRTNTADSVFGRIVEYREPCETPGWLGLTSGTFARLDVAMMCKTTSGKFAEYSMQTLARLSFQSSKDVIKNTTSASVIYTVTDAGDPVSGATVSVAGAHGTTNTLGKVTLNFPAGLAPKHYQIIVSAANYFTARGTLVVES